MIDSAEQPPPPERPEHRPPEAEREADGRDSAAESVTPPSVDAGPPESAVGIAADAVDGVTSGPLGDVFPEVAGLAGPLFRVGEDVWNARELVVGDITHAAGESVRAIAGERIDPVAGMSANEPGQADAVEWQAYESLREGVEHADVATDPDSAVFYAGHDPVFAEQGDAVRNRVMAESYAMQADKQTLEMTAGGAWLEEQTGADGARTPNLSDEQRAELWDRISERYAEAASGEVVVFDRLPNPHSPAGDTWDRVERPALLANPAVGAENIRFV